MGGLMQTHIELLAEQAHAPRVAITAELDAALQALDAEFEALAPQLQVEYIGPGVGVEGQEDVYRLAVRYHEWVMNQPSWSLKICDALPNAQWRAAWAIQGASRARKALLVRGLPQFMRGFAEAVRAAGKANDAAGRRVEAMARAFEAGGQ